MRQSDPLGCVAIKRSVREGERAKSSRAKIGARAKISTEPGVHQHPSPPLRRCFVLAPIFARPAGEKVFARTGTLATQVI